MCAYGKCNEYHKLGEEETFKLTVNYKINFTCNMSDIKYQMKRKNHNFNKAKVIIL